MTRVEKINLAIEILHMQKGMAAPEIKEYLRARNIHVDAEVIQDEIRALRYKPATAKVARPWFLQMQDKLTPLLAALAKEITKHGMRYETAARLLNELGVQKPVSQGGRWKRATLCAYLRQRKIYQHLPFGKPREYLTYQDFCARIEALVLRLEAYAEWERAYREEGSPWQSGQKKNKKRAMLALQPQ